MGRARPIGRDRLGILGGPVGAAAALSGTHANHVIGLNDFIVEWSVRVDGAVASATSYPMSAYDGAVDWFSGYLCATGGLSLQIGAAYYPSAIGISSPRGTMHHVMIFADRNGNAYFYVDGAQHGAAVDISGSAASNLDGQLVAVGGGAGGGGRNGILSLARLFVIDPANFPTVAQMAAIAAERFANPDAESQTLLARANYATERRVDIDFVDVDQDGATVPNKGTGAATFAIPGGLHWHDVRTQAERSMISRPGEDWYCFDSTHRGGVTADIGCIQGSYVMEYIRLGNSNIGTAGTSPVRFDAAGSAELLYFYKSSDVRQALTVRTNSVITSVAYQDTGYAPYVRDGISRIHIVVDADANTFTPYINGQALRTQALLTDLNLSGNVVIYMGDLTCAVNILALRLWNAASLPADYATIIRRRVVDPWRVTDGFTGMTLRGNWEGRAGAQLASSTVLINQANPGVGDLLVSGGASFGSARVLCVRGLVA